MSGNKITETSRAGSYGIICAGFGGQGIMVLGKVLTRCGMREELHVTWLPSYGAEVRGGTAHSQVRISTDPVASPVVKTPDILVIMNGPSLSRFMPSLREGGLAVINSSMVDAPPETDVSRIVMAPLTEEALKIGNVRVANMIAAAIVSLETGIFSLDTLQDVIVEMAQGREELIRPNLDAVKAGCAMARDDKERRKI